MVRLPPITLTQLSYFVECAQTLNMTAAGQELHIAQSAVSTAISQLEKAVGTPLFIRQHSKGLVLTPAGEELLPQARQIFGLIGDAVESVQAGRTQVRGTVVVACFKTIAPFLLPGLIVALGEKYPELTVDVLEGDHDECIAALRSGRAEIALTYHFTDVDGVDSHVVGSARPHIIVGAGHRIAGRSEVALSELSTDPFVLLDLPDSRDYFLSMLRQAGVTPRVSHRSSNYETVRSLVAVGQGFSILNQRPRIDQTYMGDRTVMVEISDSVPSLQVVVSALGRAMWTGKATAVKESVEAVLAEARGADRAGDFAGRSSTDRSI